MRIDQGNHDWYGPRTAVPRPAPPTLRAVAVVTLVVAGLLGSAYALGRSLVPDPPAQQTAGGTTSAAAPHSTSSGPRGDARWPEPTGPADGAEHPPLDPDSQGPFGSRVSTGSTQVALTFDDGPDPLYTPQVLEVLRQYSVRATFCVLGQSAQDHPELVQAIVADGHTLCNHSWQHDVNLGRRSPAVIRKDLLRTNRAIRAAVPNARIEYFRQPGGAWTYPVVSTARSLGMTSLHWSVDTSDWTAPGPGRITATVLSETAPGSIVLMHDAGGDRTGTVRALQRILPVLTDRFEVDALAVGTT